MFGKSTLDKLKAAIPSTINNFTLENAADIDIELVFESLGGVMGKSVLIVDGMPMPGIHRFTYNINNKKGVLILESWCSWMRESASMIKAFEKLGLDVSYTPTSGTTTGLT